MIDREATRKALLDSVKIGKVSGIRAGADVLRILAQLGKDLRADDVLNAAMKLESMAKKIESEIPKPEPK